MDSVETDKSSRFVWKRNIKYDLQLLHEVNSKNPFAFNNQKPVWMDVAKSLQEGHLKMKVTDRSCRERVTELLKKHRKDELISITTSGISEEEMSELNVLLTSVSLLESTKPDKQLKSLYSRKDKDEAEAIRAKALQDALNIEDPFLRKEAVEEIELELEDAQNRKRKAEKSKEKDDVSDKDFEFGPNSKAGKFEGPSNPKKDLVKYLEKKNEKDIALRKEELLLREKEVENKTKEVENQKKEAENKGKELDIMRLKAEAEIEERKKITDLLLKLATSK